MNRSDAIKLLAILKAAWPNHPFSEESAVAYHIGLDDLPFDAVQQAVGLAIKTRTFAPVPAELRKIILDTAFQLETPEEAWEIVMRQVRSRGSWHGPDPENPPLIKRAIDAIGWDQICQSEEIGVERAHFLRIYSAFREREVHDQNLGLGSGTQNPIPIDRKRA